MFQLFDNNLLFNLTINEVSEAIFVSNTKGRILFSNDAASRLTGYSKNQLETMKLTDLSAHSLPESTNFLKQLRAGKNFTLRTKHRHNSGNLYEVEMRCIFRKYQTKELLCSFVKELPDQKISETESNQTAEQLKVLLEESERRFRDLFEEAPIAYVHEGLDSRFIKANRAAIEMLGITREESVSIYGKTLVVDSVENQKRLKAAFQSINQGTNTKGVVLELKRKDNGESIWVQWWSKPDISGLFTRTMMVDITEMVQLEREQENLKAQNLYLQDEIKFTHNFEEIISKNKAFHQVLHQIEKVATTDATVLISGESGTGKELLARAVHNISKRSNRALIKINCANLPSNLIESELFGHERGAFTGAMERKIGRFELANDGTIFLDEIGELPLELQAKLLRVLQEGEFERLGNPKTIKVNVRVIAATNRNLETAIAKKEFREDLYYRLNVFQIVAPPLRERKEDIPLLVKHFVKKYESKMGRHIKNIPDKVIKALMRYDWPGNIRELENRIERALIITSGDTLQFGEWIPAYAPDERDGDGELKLLKMEDIERKHVISILNRTNWRVSGDKGAAKILGLNPNTLYSRMKKLGIER